MGATLVFMIEIRQLDGNDVWAQMEGLAGVLVDCVEGGASVNFMQGYSLDVATLFFESVADAVDRGERLAFAAIEGEEVLGTVQVIVKMPPNQPHRGEVTKLLVRRAARGRGVAQRLMEEAETAARVAGKSVLTLDTASDTAERLYARMGWNRVGAIPEFCLLPDGTPCATTIFWKAI